MVKRDIVMYCLAIVLIQVIHWTCAQSLQFSHTLKTPNIPQTQNNPHTSLTRATPQTFFKKDFIRTPFIECGDNENSTVNVTYIGDNIYTMYPIGHDKQCSSEPLENLKHIIYNVKHRDCGMTFNNRTKLWSIEILVQKLDSLVTAQDRIFNLMCVYESWTSESQETNVTFFYSSSRQAQQLDEIKRQKVIIDPVGVKMSVMNTLTDILKDSYTIRLRILGADREPVANLYTGKTIILSVEFQSVIASLYSPPAVTKCFISDSVVHSQATFEDEFINNGCGNGIALPSHQGFEKDDIVISSTYRSFTPEMVVLASWTKTEKVFFVCYVVVCHRDLGCRDTCPLDMAQFYHEPEKTVTAEVRSPVLLITDDDKEIIKTVEIQKTIVVWDGTKWIILNWPYLIVVGGLVIILLIFGCIMLCVVRAAVHCKKCHKCHQACKHASSRRQSRPLSISPAARPDSGLSVFSRGDSGIDESLDPHYIAGPRRSSRQSLSSRGSHQLPSRGRSSPQSPTMKEISQKSCSLSPFDSQKPESTSMFHKNIVNSAKLAAVMKPTKHIPYVKIPIAVSPRNTSQDLATTLNDQLNLNQPSTSVLSYNIPKAPLLTRSVIVNVPDSTSLPKLKIPQTRPEKLSRSHAVESDISGK